MGYFTKRYHPPGTPPGTLAPPEPGLPAGVNIHLVDYTEDTFFDQAEVPVEACRRYLERPSITWVHVNGQLDPAAMRHLGEMFGVPDLVMEDVVNVGQRPKTEWNGDRLFVVLALPHMENGGVGVRQVSLYASERFVISFHAGQDDPFEPVRRRLQAATGQLRKRGTGYLLYALVDLVIDQGFPVLEDYGEKLEDLEDELLDDPTRATIGRIHKVKQEMLLLRRALWPHREAVNALLRDDCPVVRADTRSYLRDCYDHVVHIMDLLETYRDMTANMMDVYLSSIGQRTNEVMRVLTIIATIFIPLTFITGVYGMNFGDHGTRWAMPELRWDYGYPVVWGVMVAAAVGMLIYFRRRDWF